MRRSVFYALVSVLCFPIVLGGCVTAPAKTADNRIRLVENADGTVVAVPPECVSWKEGWGDVWANDEWPSYGCATARNLAAQVADPRELARGKPIGPADGIVASGAIARYQAGETTSFIDISKQNVSETNKAEDTRTGGAPQK